MINCLDLCGHIWITLTFSVFAIGTITFFLKPSIHLSLCPSLFYCFFLNRLLGGCSLSQLPSGKRWGWAYNLDKSF